VIACLEDLFGQFRGDLPVDRAHVSVLQECLQARYRRRSPECIIPRRVSQARFGLPDSIDDLCRLLYTMRYNHETLVHGFPELRDTLLALQKEVTATTRRLLADVLQALDAPLRDSDGLVAGGRGGAAVSREAKSSAPVPDGLEAAAVTHHHRRTGTQLKVLDVDTGEQTIELGNFPGESVIYRWVERADSDAFEFVTLDAEEDGT